MSSKDWRLSKYSLLAHIYFFFNSVLLPKGLLFTNVLSPLFYIKLLQQKRKTYWLPFSMLLLAFDLFHFWQGAEVKALIVSNLLFISTYFFVIAFYHFVNNYDYLGKIYKQLLSFNALMVLIAIPFFFFPRVYKEVFWYFNPFTRGVADFPRLALLTYEASYYSLMMVPIAFYYVLKYLFKQLQHNKRITMALVIVPFLLSFSLGVMGASLITAVILCIVFWKRLFKYKRTFVLFVSILVVIVGTTTVLFVYFPANFFVIRIQNIMSGNDTSTNGRTTDSFAIAWRIAEMKNIWFGAGLGQIKIVIGVLVKQYFSHWGNYVRYDIPNAMGETLAIFGITGVVLRLALETWLFFKTKVFLNYYRLALFIFIFIYQFTGSFITNSVEYVIWVLAFSNVFQQFDVKPRQMNT